MGWHHNVSQCNEENKNVRKENKVFAGDMQTDLESYVD